MSSRGRQAATTTPGGSGTPPGTSFMPWTAASISPASRTRLVSLAHAPLAAERGQVAGPLAGGGGDAADR